MARDVGPPPPPDPRREAAAEISNAATTEALTRAIPSDHPVWGKLAVLWMKDLLRVLEEASRSGQLDALDRHVDRAGGGTNSRLRVAIDAVKMKIGSSRELGQTAANRRPFAERLAVLPEQQRQEVMEYVGREPAFYAEFARQYSGYVGVNPTPRSAVSDSTVEKLIKDELAARGGDVEIAFVFMRERRNQPGNCGNQDLAAAEHYMFARLLVQLTQTRIGDLPGFVINLGISGYDFLKQNGVRVPLLNCPTSEPSDAQVKWGWKGVADEKQAVEGVKDSMGAVGKKRPMSF